MERQILDFIKIRGPSVPVEVSSHLKKESFLVSAMLSDLLRQGKLKISHIMVGRSKLYYIPGQEHMLVNFSKYLNEKDRFTYNILNEKKVLRDKTLNPLSRVSIRNLKDFAVGLDVNNNGEREVFWKWFLLDNSEVESKIKAMLGLVDYEKKSFVKEKNENALENDNKISDEKELVKDTLKKYVQDELNNAKNEIPKDNGKNIIKEEINEAVENDEEEVKSLDIKKENKTNEEKSEKIGNKLIKNTNQIIKKEIINDSEKNITKKKSTSSDFINKVRNFLTDKGLGIVKEFIIKKNEVDFEADIPGPLGSMRYYIKAKQKKSMNEGDLSSAFVSGQSKKLPVYFLSYGKMTKKALEKAKKEMPSLNVVVFDGS